MTDILAGIAVSLGILGLVHQKLSSGVCFNWEQFWHHEPLIALCFVAGVCLLMGKYIK